MIILNIISWIIIGVLACGLFLVLIASGVYMGVHIALQTIIEEHGVDVSKEEKDASD